VCVVVSETIDQPETAVPLKEKEHTKNPGK